MRKFGCGTKGTVLVRPRFILPVVIVSASTLRLWAAPPQSSPDAATRQRALIDKYCVSCYNQKARAAGLMLDKLDLERVPQVAEVWEKAIRKLRAV